MSDTSTINTAPKDPPLLDGSRIVGSLAEVRHDYLATILRAADVADVVRIKAGPPGWRRTFYSICTPEAVHHILGQPDLYTKQTPAYDELRSGLGNGMLTSEGDEWRRQRRFLAPIFTARRISTSYADIVVHETSLLVDRWNLTAAAGTEINAHAEMIDLASRIIGRILFGADMTGTISQIMHFSYVNDLLRKRGIAPHKPPMWVPTAVNRRLSTGLRGLRGLVADIVAQRRATQSDAPVNDMLGLLLAARDDENPGHRLTDTEVADQVLIFLIAGHETTATTLACSLVELARSPHWQSAVHSELREVLGTRVPTGADVSALHLTGQVARESMRMYPPAHSIGRRVGADDIVCGYRIPAGGVVVISPWTVHRSPKVWRDPNTFDPTRFDVQHGQPPGGHRYAWFPFGAGPHTCVGMQLALMEAPLVLATILQAFGVSTQIQSIPVRAAVTLRPSTPLPIRLERV